MKNNKQQKEARPVSARKRIIEARTLAAIESGDIRGYLIATMHDWLRTLTLLGSILVPLFFVLDIFMMPASFLPRFAVYRGASAAIALIQLLVVRLTKPSRWSYLHGYLMTLQVGLTIAIMTHDLGGFSSSYYAGLNLVVIGVNLLMPWGAFHTAANSFLTIAIYATINLVSKLPLDRSILINNLFFLVATAFLATAINYVRIKLVKKEFSLLIALGKARDDLLGEKRLVEERDRSLKNLLDLSGQGFLSFDRNFLVQAEYSKECESILGPSIAGQRIDRLLYPDVGSQKIFMDGLDLYFTGRSKADVIFDLLDHGFQIRDLTVKAEYKAITEDRVMLVLTDVTEELRLQEESRRENDKWNFILKVIANKSAFASLDREAEAFFAAFGSRQEDFDALLREIHTFKGDAGFLGFKNTQNAAHQLEDFIADQFALGLGMDLSEAVAPLAKAYADERAVICEALGSQWTQDASSIEVPKALFLRIGSYIKMHCPDPQILEALEALRRKPLAGLFGRFPQMVADLASRLGKRIGPVKIAGGDITVVADDYEELIGSFSHIIRNMVDHGVEPPRERESKGKKAVGEIGIEIQKKANEIVFTFIDDGKGIQLSDLKKRAEELGIVARGEATEPNDLVPLIFRDGFSTSTNVSEISGRGIGLSAVREAVHRMDGHIRVQTSKDRGTVFSISIPTQR